METTNYAWPMPDPNGSSQQMEIQRVADGISQADATVKAAEDALAALNSAYSLHAHSFAAITSKPTTIAGYGITDAYTKTQINDKVAADISAAIAGVLNGAPGALDTLQELAAALGDDPNFAATITNGLAGKLAKGSNLADLPNKSTALSNLGISNFIKSLLDDANQATALATLGANDASNLNAGTVNDARLPSRQSAKSFSSPLEVSANPSVYGSVQLVTGTSNNPGYVAFIGPDGVRRGYIGYSSGDRLRIQNDNGWGWYIAGEVDFQYTPKIAGNVFWHAGNDGPGSGLDADLLDGAHADASAAGNTIVLRNGYGYVFGNIFHMDYASTNATVHRIITQNAADGYMRPSTPAQVASALMPASDRSFSQNGFQKLPSGFIMQWGLYSGSADSATITYPVAFPNAVLGVFVAPFTGGWDTWNWRVTSRSAASAVVRTHPASRPFQWFAIGW